MRAEALLKSVTKKLASITPDASFESKCLLEHYLGISLEDVILHKDIGEPDLSKIEAAIAQRREGVPLQHILGKWDFMGLEFLVSPSVLIPRQETELLVEYFADKLTPESIVYDLCAGSGCIGISLSKLSGAKVIAVEKYPEAVEVLKKNLELHPCALNVFTFDITLKPSAAFEKADVIVSNPPYIESATIPTLQKEVLQEPMTALDGGEDGLLFYRAIAANFTDLLKSGGYLGVEIGEGQEDAVKRVFGSLKHIETIRDYNDIPRVIIFRKENS